MSKIVLGMNGIDDIKKAYPITVDISDEKRQALAYNMLYYMMGHGAQIMVDGKQLPFEKDRLYTCTKKHVTEYYTKPHLDPEWYGANGEHFVDFIGDKNSVTIITMADDQPVYFAPETVSLEKANEMYNFIGAGFDSSVSISYPVDDKMAPIVKNGVRHGCHC